jgi:hypothetical protein
MIAFTISKYIIGIVGLGLTFYYLVLYLNGKTNLKKAGWFFFSTWVLIIIITVIEFLIYSNK